MVSRRASRLAEVVGIQGGSLLTTLILVPLKTMPGSEPLILDPLSPLCLSFLPHPFCLHTLVLPASSFLIIALPGGASGKESSCQCRRRTRCGFEPWVGKIPWRREWQPNFSILDWRIPQTEEPGRLYGPWGHKEMDMTERLSTHTRQIRRILSDH